MKILIKNADILTINDHDEVLYGTDLLIEDNLIKKIGKNLTTDADKIIDAENKILMPGFINAHTHLAMSVFRNYADDLPFWEWLFEKIIPAEEKLTGEIVYHSSMLSIAEMIKSGTTSFNDMYFFLDDIARAVKDTGIRANLALGMVGESKEDKHKVQTNIDLFKKYHGSLNNRLKISFGPHAPYTCSDQFYEYILEGVKETGANIHTHLSESQNEINESKEKYGCSPIVRMEKLGLFGYPVAAAHCVYLDDNDLEIMQKNNVTVVHNPSSNLKLANGFANVDKMLQKGINVALGTDGPASNNNQNMMEEMHLASLIAKGYLKSPTVLKATEVLRMATRNGARVLGYDNLGIVKEGFLADLILIDTNKAHLQPKSNLAATIVYSAQASDVETVIVDGRILMENRELVGLDLEKIIQKANQVQKEILN